MFPAVNTRMFSAVVVSALVCCLCGCSSSGRVSTPDGQRLVPTTATASVSAVPLRPEGSEAVTRADEFIVQNVPDDAGLARKARAGHGEFAGVIVSWVAPGARLLDPESHSDVMVTVDGEVAQPPMVNVDPGLTTDGFSYGSPGAREQQFNEYAVELAQANVGVDASGTPLAGTKPFISAYVIKYPWGYVVTAPSYDYTQLGSSPNSPSFAFRPLSLASRQHLDTLDATETAQAWLRAPSYAQMFWLSSAKRRLYLLKPNAGIDPQGRTAKVPFRVRLSSEDSSGYQADPQIRQVKTFTVEPTDQYGGMVIVGRPDSDSPWRVLDTGW